MSVNTKNKIEAFNKSYGVLFTFLWRFIFYPILGLVLYSASSYLRENYVSKSYFDSAVAKIESGQREVSQKIDTLLIRESAAIEKAGDLDRRIIRLENYLDRTPGKVAWQIRLPIDEEK